MLLAYFPSELLTQEPSKLVDILHFVAVNISSETTIMPFMGPRVQQIMIE